MKKSKTDKYKNKFAKLFESTVHEIIDTATMDLGDKLVLMAALCNLRILYQAKVTFYDMFMVQGSLEYAFQKIFENMDSGDMNGIYMDRMLLLSKFCNFRHLMQDRLKDVYDMMEDMDE